MAERILAPPAHIREFQTLADQLFILIADDEPLILDIICEALAPLDCLIETLDDGLAVAETVSLKRPDLIILDCSMPGLSGVDALRQIRASDECFAIPVLMLTGRRSAADRAIAERAGANHYMCKPFNPSNLLARVEYILAEAQARAESSFTPKIIKVVESASRQSISQG